MKLIRFISETEYNTLIDTGEVKAGIGNERSSWSHWTTSVLYFFRLKDNNVDYNINDFIPFVSLLKAYYQIDYDYAIEIRDEYARKSRGIYPADKIEDVMGGLPSYIRKFEQEELDEEDFYVVPEAKVPAYNINQIKKLYRVDRDFKLTRLELPPKKVQEANQMRRTIKIEAKQLEGLELEIALVDKIKDKYGLSASLTQLEANLYQVAIENTKELSELDLEDVVMFVEELFKKLVDNKDITAIRHDNFIYVGAGSELLVPKLEATQSTSVAIGQKQDYICALCGKKHKGDSFNGWPLFSKIEERVCLECSGFYVLPERLSTLRTKKTKVEAASKGDVEEATSNLVLDSKFVWLFSVMDESSNEIAEGIDKLQDAIEILIENNATFLVAFPYVDPKPEDSSVDLVFADTPGPIVIYNREETTATKSKGAK